MAEKKGALNLPINLFKTLFPSSLVEIQETLEDLPSLELADIQRETIKHSQLAAAKENLKHIFMLPETVRQSEALITDGKLLDAHKVWLTSSTYYSIRIKFTLSFLVFS